MVKLEVKLRELKEIAEREKIILTPEIEKYLQENIEVIQVKLSKGEKIYQKDLKFIRIVKGWMEWTQFPKKWQERFQDFETIIDTDEYKESKKRNITIPQWLTLLEMFSFYFPEKRMKVIEEKCEFPGKKRIILKDKFHARSKVIPDNLTVEGSMDLSSTDLLLECRGLIVKGALSVKLNENDETFPSGIEAKHINLSNCKALKSLPDDIKCKSLSLRDCEVLSELPSSLNLEDSLTLENCPNIENLPQNLRVGSLLCEECHKLKTIPKEVLETLGSSTSMPAHILTQIDDCQAFAVLPDVEEIKGDLLMKNCKNLKTLPTRLKVYGNVNLSNCRKIEQLPDPFEVHGNLNLSNCRQLKKLPETIKVRGVLNIRACKKLTSLPDDLSVDVLKTSPHLHEQVLKDAEKLLAAGKIKKIKK